MKAVIPVRKGSVRVKNKNLKSFAGKSLLEYKIEQLKRVDDIEEVIVNSDCELMLNVAKKMGVSFKKRESFYASSEVSINLVWQDIAKNMDCETIIYVNATSPMISDSTIKSCIKKYKEEGLFEKKQSLNTVTSIREFLWNKEGPINYDKNNQPRSQDLPLVYHPNFGVNIIDKETMYGEKTIITDRFFPFFIDKVESIDIDDELDFEIAEILFTKRSIE
jgi:CMP-N-acetylneuraminic acid synthetase